MGVRIVPSPRRLTLEERRAFKLAQLHKVLSQEPHNADSFNWMGVYAMTAEIRLTVDEVRAAAASLTAVAEKWDEVIRGLSAEAPSGERLRELERERQREHARQQDVERAIDAMTLQDVWPVVMKAWANRRSERRAWSVFAITARWVNEEESERRRSS
jgi:hypothetical protein